MSHSLVEKDDQEFKRQQKAQTVVAVNHTTFSRTNHRLTTATMGKQLNSPSGGIKWCNNVLSVKAYCKHIIWALILSTASAYSVNPIQQDIKCPRYGASCLFIAGSSGPDEEVEHQVSAGTDSCVCEMEHRQNQRIWLMKLMWTSDWEKSNFKNIYH